MDAVVATLNPAAELARADGVRRPGESRACRERRDALRAEEIEQRRHIEQRPACKRSWPRRSPYADTRATLGRNYRAGPAAGVKARVFHLLTPRSGNIRHVRGGGMGAISAGRGPYPCSAPDRRPLWTALDDAPIGRGEHGYPRPCYGR